MSYQTYTTEALVCGAFERNTSDRSFRLFTKTAGMIYATARSVREERSKQRYALQEFSRVRVSLIKGKRGWRVGSVEVSQNDYSLAISREVRGSVLMLYRMLRRFIHGEEPMPELFDFCIEALDELIKNDRDREFLELFVQSQILFKLGYVDNKEVPKLLYESRISEIYNHQKDIGTKELSVIVERAIHSSHL